MTTKTFREITTVTLAVVASLILNAKPAFAQSDDERDMTPGPAYHVVIRGEQRPSMLVPLYGVLGALQSLDTYTTLRGTGGQSLGIREGNPIVKHHAALFVAKAATTATMVLLAEKMWKKNRKAAVIAVLAANAVTGAVVAHNYRVINQQLR
jgi:hypothetical protein